MEIIRNIITLITTLIFSILLILVGIATEKLWIIIITIIFSFILFGTTIIDAVKRRKFLKPYTIVTTLVMLVVLLTMIRPLLDNLYVKDLIFNLEYILNNILVLFYENLFVYIIIFILVFIGNYVSIKELEK